MMMTSLCRLIAMVPNNSPTYFWCDFVPTSVIHDCTLSHSVVG